MDDLDALVTSVADLSRRTQSLSEALSESARLLADALDRIHELERRAYD